MYKLNIFDSDGNLKATRVYRRKYVAINNGKHWKTLVQGNTFKVETTD